MNEHAFLWTLPALVAVFVALQLLHGRIVLGWSAGEWRFIEKTDNQSRFWLFIVGESILVLALIAQAIFA